MHLLVVWLLSVIALAHATSNCRLKTPWTDKLDPTNVLPEYPRPQLVRSTAWKNLNGAWEYQPGLPGEQPPFGKTLNGSIIVPFPVESCLSGVGVTAKYLWYRKVFDTPFQTGMLRFGAVDWQTTVWLNGHELGNHTGGYDGFAFYVSAHLKSSNNELIVFVFDPSDDGTQPFGKQRLSAIQYPGGDTYTPASGIWQTVWLEQVPASGHIESLVIHADLTTVVVRVSCSGCSSSTNALVQAMDGSSVVASAKGSASQTFKLTIPSPKLWSPTSPFLYNLSVSIGSDKVLSYFGMRTFTLGTVDGITRPLLNGKTIFLNGWLDQGFWPDGIYTPATDEALRFDIEAVKTFGFNTVRKHQKVEPERWYHYADKMGVILFQDAVQHYGCNVKGNCPPSHSDYMHDLTTMITGRYNHPCIVQWTAFNEQDMVSFFNVSEVVDYIRITDPTRLVDTDSGGPANNEHVGDVNDVHTYPNPRDPGRFPHQYGMVGEFGGLGSFTPGHEWDSGHCYAYKTMSSPAALATLYEQYLTFFESDLKNVSASIVTQITDTENECDGFFNYDRSNKFDAATTQAIYNANQKLIATLSSRH